MQNDKVPYPEIYKDKWLKFDKTLLYPMEINDCNDTIDGMCFENLTLDECTEKCVGDCDFGYHVKVDNKSICVPIRSRYIVMPIPLLDYVTKIYMGSKIMLMLHSSKIRMCILIPLYLLHMYILCLH